MTEQQMNYKETYRPPSPAGWSQAQPDQGEVARAAVIQCWFDSRDLSRSDIIDIVARFGGVTPVPDFVEVPSELLAMLAQLVADFSAQVQDSSAGAWAFVVDAPTRMMTFMTTDVLTMVLDKMAADQHRVIL